MSATITDIHDAIVQTMKDNTALADAVNKRIETFHGELADLIAEVEQLTIKLPAIYLLYTASTFTEDGIQSYTDAQVYSVVAITKDLRGKDYLKEDMYSILELLKTALINAELDVTRTTPIVPVAINATVISKTYSVFSFDIRLNSSYN